MNQHLQHRDAELCIYDTLLGRLKFTSFKDKEAARVENVKLLGDEKGSTSNINLGYAIRYSRNPVIGDNFSSRYW